jgi:hypothetical protein
MIKMTPAEKSRGVFFYIGNWVFGFKFRTWWCKSKMIKMQGFWFGRANYNIIPTALLAEFKPCVKEIGVNWDEENQGFSIRANSHRTYNFYSNERYHCDRFYPSVRNVCKNQHPPLHQFFIVRLRITIYILNLQLVLLALRCFGFIIFLLLCRLKDFQLSLQLGFTLGLLFASSAAADEIIYKEQTQWGNNK